MARKPLIILDITTNAGLYRAERHSDVIVKKTRRALNLEEKADDEFFETTKGPLYRPDVG